MKTNLPQEAQCGCSGSDFNLLGTAMVSMNSYLNLMPMWFGAFYDQWGVRNGGSRAFFFFTSSTQFAILAVHIHLLHKWSQPQWHSNKCKYGHKLKGKTLSCLNTFVVQAVNHYSQHSYFGTIFSPFGMNLNSHCKQPNLEVAFNSEDLGQRMTIKPRVLILKPNCARFCVCVCVCVCRPNMQNPTGNLHVT